MRIKRNVESVQGRGVRLLIQVGSTAFLWGDVPDDPRKGTLYPWRLEILTPAFRFRFRRSEWAKG